MKIKVQFVLSKGEGTWPDISQLPSDKQNLDYIKSCMEFMPAFYDAELVIIDWSLVNAGLDELTLTNGTVQGFPRPLVEFTVNEKLINEFFPDKKDFLRAVWESTYQFLVPGSNDNDPFFFADYNGYTQIV